MSDWSNNSRGAKPTFCVAFTGFFAKSWFLRLAKDLIEWLICCEKGLLRSNSLRSNERKLFTA